MTDSYDVGGVKVTPGGGGYYTLEHSTLGEAEKVRGKEYADTRAAEISKAVSDAVGDSAIEGQGELDPNKIPKPQDITTTDSLKNEANAPQEPAPKPSPAAQQAASQAADVQTQNLDPAAQTGEDPKDAAIRVLQEQMKMMLQALQDVTTVQAAAPAPIDTVPHDVPRTFAGEMDPKAKKALKAAGVGVVKIVLEENESIPPTGLFVGHNGRSYMIKPGEPVDVPQFLVDVLNDAVMSAPIVDGSSQKVLGYRDRSKYPYRVVN